MIDQLLIAGLAVAFLAGAVSGWIARDLEKNWTAEDPTEDGGRYL
jgi:hypothetical protein